MRLKLGTTREISERRQVGDAEEMFAERGVGGERHWWRNVGMEEGM
jgi:pyruvate dehydrogenase kinase 2/3/4